MKRYLCCAFSVLLVFGKLAVLNAGDQSSRQQLRQAFERAAKITDAELRGRVYHALALAQSLAGETEDAVLSAARVSNSQLQIYAYLAVARQHAKLGHKERMREATRQAREAALRAKKGAGRVDTNLIGWLVDNNMTAEAIADAKALKKSHDRSFALAMICARLALRNDVATGLELMKREVPSAWRRNTLVMMAQRTSSEGRIADTERLAKMMSKAEDQDKAYLGLIQTLARREPKSSELEGLAAKISSSSHRDLAKAALAGSRGQLTTDELRKRLGQAGGRDEKIAIHQKLFQLYLKQKKAPQADSAIADMVKTIRANPRKQVATKFGTQSDEAQIAVIQIQAVAVANLLRAEGDAAGARQRLAKARQAVEAMPDQAGLGKVMASATILDALITVGEVEDALQMMNKLPPLAAGPRLKTVAVALANKGRLDDVSKLLRHHEKSAAYWSSGAIAEVCKVLMNSGQVAKIPDLLQHLGSTNEDYQAYRSLARGLAAAGKSKVVAEWMPKWPPAAQAYAHMGLADAKKR